MKFLFTILIFVVYGYPLVAQVKLTPGAALLFNQTKSTISAADKNKLFAKTGFVLSDDKKQFLMSDDPAVAAYPFSVTVYPADLNNDGKEEIALLYGNESISGKAGSNIVLFIKDKNGEFQQQFGFSGTMPMVFAAAPGKFPDLLIGGPGDNFPVWRWNGKDYVFHHTITQAKLTSAKPVSLATISKAYCSKIR